MSDYHSPGITALIANLDIALLRNALGIGQLRIVGGAVRDAILNKPLGDIDLATPLPPDTVIARLNIAGIKVVPTGIAHGTVTAVIDKTGYEITTLRRDIETFGRHASVEFTDDWQDDAARRDFTFNALSLDENGKIYDYFSGIDDLHHGRVRFIGDAETRIREDVLRILRFFRFYAFYGWTSVQLPAMLDADAMAACEKLRDLIPNLSAERIGNEIRKLLGAPNPVPAWQAMHDCGVAAIAVPEAVNTNRLSSLVICERALHEEKNNYIGDAAIRFAALVGRTDIISLAKRLRLSNKECKTINALSEACMLPLDTQQHVRIALYTCGASVIKRSLALIKATGGSLSPDINTIIQQWQPPAFPLTGNDLKKLNIDEGEELGKILKTVHQWWMAMDFTPSFSECVAKALSIKGTLNNV